MPGFWCEHAWLDGAVVPGVLVSGGAVVTAVSRVDTAPPGAHRLAGVVFPGFANVHSHAFHRALRGRAGGSGTFWTWREAMYSLAGRLDPGRLLALATAAYAELVCAGWTAVGEFHYLHGPSPGAMADALAEAARLADIRLVLLDTLYLAGGIGSPLADVQRRFAGGGFEAWASRVSAGVGGAAVHSVRAVPRCVLDAVGSVLGPDRPLHVHVSEQPAEDEACLAAYGLTPTGVLAEAGLLSGRTTAVHATHVSDVDVSLLGAAGVTVCGCPTTEADLADGLGPLRALASAGCPLALGSDAHVVVDPFAEARGLEHGERLRSGRRGRFDAGELVAALTSGGCRALGLPGGRLAVGAPCDLVAVHSDSPRTAGAALDQLVLTASASDVDTVVVGGRVVARGGAHVSLGEVGPLLAAAIDAAWR